MAVAWVEFDEPFLTRNVQSVSIVDTELKVKDPQVPSSSHCSQLTLSWIQSWHCCLGSVLSGIGRLPDEDWLSVGSQVLGAGGRLCRMLT